MSKPRVFIAITAIALLVPLTVTGQKSKPTKPPVTAMCIMQGQVDSRAATVEVGRDVVSYGPIDRELYIHDSLLPPLGSTDFPGLVAELRAVGPDGEGFYGPYRGQIRVLDDRLDYYFDTAAGCVQADAPENRCRFRLIVVDGMALYAGKGKTRTLVKIAFEDGRTLLDYRPCDPATNPSCYVKLYGCYDDRDCPNLDPDKDFVYATFAVKF